MTITHKYGYDTRVYSSEKAATRSLAYFARYWWGDAVARFNDRSPDDPLPDTPPDDDRECIAMYFDEDAMGEEESANIEETEVRS